MGYNGVFGITRYHITAATAGRGGYRFEESADCWALADALYRRVFAAVGMPLAHGSRLVESVPNGGVGTADLFDRHLGVDVALRLAGGRKLTLQEKFLTTDFETVTVEYMNDAARGLEGDWFTMLPHLLFVGYVDAARATWRRWIVLHWSAVVAETEQGSIRWQERANGRDGARASFRYAPFDAFPPWCVLASSKTTPLAEQPAAVTAGVAEAPAMMTAAPPVEVPLMMPPAEREPLRAMPRSPRRSKITQAIVEGQQLW